MLKYPILLTPSVLPKRSITLQDRISDVFVTDKPAKRKEPPQKRPPIESPRKPKKPIGDPPSKRSPKRVAPQDEVVAEVRVGIACINI